MNSKFDKITYTPSLFAENNFIYLQEIGEATYHIPSFDYHQNTNSYLFYIILEGKMRIIYNDEEIILSSGQCVFIDCHKKYEYILSQNRGLKIKWIYFYGVNINNIYEKFIKSCGSFYFTANNIDQYDKLLSEIYDMAENSHFANDIKIYELIIRLLGYIMNEIDDKKIIISNKIKIEPVKTYLEQHFVEYITLDDLEKRFHINKYYLTKLFKEEYNISIITYLNQLRVNKAKKLLRNSNQKIESISRICGIDDQGYFIRLFKRFEGMTPGDYRKQWYKI